MFNLLIEISLLVCLMSTALGAAADEKTSSWKLLGPAFSHHLRANPDDMPISAPARGVYDCVQNSTGTTCYGRVIDAQRSWSQNNPAFGLEYSVLSGEDLSRRDLVFATVVRDSFGKVGLMTGAGRAWSVSRIGSLNLEVGLTGGLWYRTVSEGDFVTGPIQFCHKNHPVFSDGCQTGSAVFYETKLQRRWVPFLLPVISITEQKTGLGLNIGIAP